MPIVNDTITNKSIDTKKSEYHRLINELENNLHRDYKYNYDDAVIRTRVIPQIPETSPKHNNKVMYSEKISPMLAAIVNKNRK